MTTSSEWKLLNKAHLRALRVVSRGFRREKSRRQLDEECKWALTRQWEYYAVSLTTATTLQNREPSLLCDQIFKNSTWNDWLPGHRIFYDSLRWKIGRQAIQNRLKEPFQRIKKEWHGIGLTKDGVRVWMKESFSHTIRAWQRNERN